jgi:hypothetical protein
MEISASSIVTRMRELYGDLAFESVKTEWYDCENCGTTTMKPLWAPGEFLACERCYDEAMEIQRKKDAAAVADGSLKINPHEESLDPHTLAMAGMNLGMYQIYKQEFEHIEVKQ